MNSPCVNHPPSGCSPLINRIALDFLLVPLMLPFVARCGLAGEPVKVAAPLPHSVTQRQGVVLRKATGHEPGGPRRGLGQVNVAFDLPDNLPAGGEMMVQYRVVALPGAWGTDSDWAPLPGAAQAKHWQGIAPIAAGGWYELEVRFALRGARSGGGRRRADRRGRSVSGGRSIVCGQ